MPAELVKLKKYTADHWSEKYDNICYSNNFWSLVKSVIADRSQAAEFAFEHLSKGSIQERVLAACIAGQLCNPLVPNDELTARELADVLIQAAKVNKHPSALIAIANALDYMMPSTSAINTANILTCHSDEYVRFAAACSFGSLINKGSATAANIDRLIELSNDVDPDIRDWSTMYLAQLVEYREVNQSKIRDALLARTKDKHTDTQAEAFWGLAVCKDEHGILPLRECLESSNAIGKLVIEAAGEYGSPEFYKSLKQIQSWWDVDEKVITTAIAKCSPKVYKRSK